MKSCSKILILGILVALTLVFESLFYFFDITIKAEEESTKKASIDCVLGQITNELNMFYLYKGHYPNQLDLIEFVSKKSSSLKPECGVGLEVSTGGRLMLRKNEVHVSINLDGQMGVFYSGHKCGNSEVCIKSKKGVRERN